MLRHAVNAVRRVITVYPADPWEQRAQALTDVIGQGLQSYSGVPYVGDKGDPSRSWYGPLKTTHGGQLTGGRLLGAQPNTYGDPTSRNLSNANSDVLSDDPAARIFAARLARRQR